MKDGFSFKKFHIKHDNCAMKVGTDAVLLGAIAPIDKVSKALDLGTGSGIIALMLAQRNEHAIIDAIEIENNAAKQAKENFLASDFHDRLKVHLTSHDKFCFNHHSNYNLVVANPPFFINAQGIENKNRMLARSISDNTHKSWFDSAFNALKEHGSFYVILPYNECLETIFTAYSLAKTNTLNTDFSLFLIDKRHLSGHINATVVWKIKEVILIYPNPGKKCHRIILGLEKQKLVLPFNELDFFTASKDVSFEELLGSLKKSFHIRDKEKNYSKDMIKLISPFYLKY